MTIFESLRKDHDVQRDLIKKLVDTSGDEADRRKLYSDLKQELKDHAKSEERHFYKYLMDDDLTTKKTRHSVAEHHEMDELMEKLDDTEMSSPAWLGYAKDLQEKLEHHLDEEEQEVFQLAGKVLSATQKEKLSTDYNKEMH